MAYLEWFEFVDNGMPADSGIFHVLPPAADAAGTPSMLLGAPDLFMVNPKGDNHFLEFLKFCCEQEDDVIRDNAESPRWSVIGVVNGHSVSTTRRH